MQDVAQFDVIPGIYNVKYTYETQFGDICNDINISILEDKKVELKIDGNYVTLYSNFDDAKVLINNENTGLLAKEIKNFGPIPKEKDIVIKLQRESVSYTHLLEYTFKVETDIKVEHGQFLQLSIPKVGEAPISVSGFGDGYLEFTIRSVRCV